MKYLYLILVLVLFTSEITVAQDLTSVDAAQQADELEFLKRAYQLEIARLENALANEANERTSELLDLRAAVHANNAHLWVYTAGAGFIVTVFGFWGFSMRNVVKASETRMQDQVDAIETRLKTVLDEQAVKMEQRLQDAIDAREAELKIYLLAEVERLVEKNRDALGAVLNEGDLMLKARQKRSVLILCRDDEDQIHMKEQLKTWELSNVTYTSLQKKADGPFDLVILDDHDKENIPDATLRQCFADYKESYFLFYVNHDMNLDVIPAGVRYLFAKSHVTLKTHALNTLKEIQREKLQGQV